MKVKIDKEKCIGCGSCEAICPSVFEMKDGKSTLKTQETEEKCAKEAAETCPANAIIVE